MSELAPFGYKTGWIAVRDRSQADVVEALGLAGGRQVAAEEAAEADVGTGVLPPLPGVGGRWTLAVGDALADISPTRLASLSALLGTQVQAFASHRVVEAHRWLCADGGHLVRHVQVLGESGELEAWTGEPTPVEVSLGLPPSATVEGEDAAFAVVRLVTEESVMAVAGAWSIDPTTLAGPAPGPALLVEDQDEGPPLPEPLPPQPRPWWRWSPPRRS